ncbi:MAG TPA: hypothetical protein DCE71_00160 [Parachlamydiales bacterium]|nr:hypothetical protein [Parachlamydiales bacterium]
MSYIKSATAGTIASAIVMATPVFAAIILGSEERTAEVAKIAISDSGLPKIPELNLLERIVMKRNIPVREGIEILTNFVKILLHYVLLIKNVVDGNWLAELLTHSGLRLVRGEEFADAVSHEMFNRNYLNAVLRSVVLPVLCLDPVAQLQKLELSDAINSKTILLSSSLFGAFAGKWAIEAKRPIAQYIGAVTASLGLGLSAVKIMGDAAKTNGALMLATTQGMITGVALELAVKKSEDMGVDKQVTGWSCYIATFLSVIAVIMSEIDPSASDLLSAWVAISVLSGLMAATIAQFLPRQDQQN